ncbi:MAG: DUF4326 domain-containing protein [Planctomycetota bacterium]
MSADQERPPRRVQARRAKGYKLVARPTRWGNPFPLADYSREESLRRYAEWLDARLVEDPEFLEPLRGHDLACFCRLELPCHVDIILARLYPDRADGA